MCVCVFAQAYVYLHAIFSALPVVKNNVGTERMLSAEKRDSRTNPKPRERRAKFLNGAEAETDAASLGDGCPETVMMDADAAQTDKLPS